MPLIVFYIYLFVSQTIGIIVSVNRHQMGWLAVFIGLFLVEAAGLILYLYKKRSK